VTELIVMGIGLSWIQIVNLLFKVEKLEKEMGVLKNEIHHTHPTSIDSQSTH